MNRIEKRYPGGAEQWFSPFGRTRITVLTVSQVAKIFLPDIYNWNNWQSGPRSEISIRLLVSLEPLDGFIPDKDRCIVYGVLCMTNSILLQYNLSEQYTVQYEAST